MQLKFSNFNTVLYVPNDRSDRTTQHTHTHSQLFKKGKEHYHQSKEGRVLHVHTYIWRALLCVFCCCCHRCWGEQKAMWGPISSLVWPNHLNINSASITSKYIDCAVIMGNICSCCFGGSAEKSPGADVVTAPGETTALLTEQSAQKTPSVSPKTEPVAVPVSQLFWKRTPFESYRVRHVLHFWSGRPRWWSDRDTLMAPLRISMSWKR